MIAPGLAATSPRRAQHARRPAFPRLLPPPGTASFSPGGLAGRSLIGRPVFSHFVSPSVACPVALRAAVSASVVPRCVVIRHSEGPLADAEEATAKIGRDLSGFRKHG